MPRKPSGNFDQQKYVQQWAKEHMKHINASYKSDFVDLFKESCKKLGIKQSDVFRQAMQEIIEKARRL